MLQSKPIITDPNTGFNVDVTGDIRFHDVSATLPDGRSIRAHFVCDIMGHNPGGTDWVAYYGKPSANPKPDAEYKAEYKRLWLVWANINYKHMKELYKKAVENNNTIMNCAIKNTIDNNAVILTELLNEAFTLGYRPQ